MIEVGHGIGVCYEGKDTYVIFADGRTKRYSVGGMLFEISDDEAFYMITEKVGKMIHCYPGFSDPLTEESFKDGFHWLYCAIDDEEFPVATALFQSTFFVTMNRVLEEIPALDTCSCTGDFFLRCFKEYIDDMKAFAVFTDAVTQYDSGMAAEEDKQGHKAVC